MSKNLVALAIVDKETLQIIRRVDVAGRDNRYIFEVYQGLSRKLNRKQYYVQEVKLMKDGASEIEYWMGQETRR